MRTLSRGHFPGLLGVMLVAVVIHAHAAEFTIEQNQVAVGAVETRVASASVNLLDLARRYDLGYVQLVAANPGVDPWNPAASGSVTLPGFYILPDAPRIGIVVNLAERRIFYYPPGGRTVETYPAGVGVMSDATPLGVTSVVRKELAPTWVPPPSIRAERPWLPAAIPPGPDDPLGDFALRLGWSNYLIHGTNKPDSVGRNVSHGCLHLYPEDIERLFHEVAVGTPVRVISQAVEAAWIGHRLYVEVHMSKKQADQIDNGEPVTPVLTNDVVTRIRTAAGDRINLVDWNAVQRAAMQRTGIPTAVTNAASTAPELESAVTEPHGLVGR